MAAAAPGSVEVELAAAPAVGTAARDNATADADADVPARRESAQSDSSAITTATSRTSAAAAHAPKKKAKLIALEFGGALDFSARPRPNAFASSNVIATTRYTWWSFLPKSLFEQFRRIANVYFLVQAVLMVLGEQFPDTFFETPYGSYTVTTSLVIVIGFTMVKEAVEDRKRFRKDQKTNARRTWTLDASGNFEETPWRDIKVGNIVKVFDREEMPADLVLLTSVNKDGGCYVETSNIDGETNLKIREVEPELAECVRSGDHPDPFMLSDFAGELHCEAPNKNIHTFVGRLEVDGRERPIAVGSKQFLLRGSQLRNTPWIWGLVVYTGPETKVMKNSRDAPSKLSILEQTMNKCIFLVLITQFAVCALGAMGACAWAEVNTDAYKAYLSTTTEAVLDSPWEKYHSQFFTYIVLFNNFLPISLYVTVETVLILQASFIENDLEMYDPVSDTPASVRTSNLNSDFGQVDFIFSDKTGTLTQNVMKLQQCSVGGTAYGSAKRGAVVRDPTATLPATTAFRDDRVLDTLRSAHRARGAGEEGEEGAAAAAAVAAAAGTAGHAARYLDEFLTCLTVCHTVVVEKQKSGSVTYQAESPDEGALVHGATPLGYVLQDRTADFITVSCRGIVEQDEGGGKATEGKAAEVQAAQGTAGDDAIRKYEILATNGFDATRKRMSIVVRNPQGKIVVYCKGADNKMLEVMGRTRITAEEVATLNDHLGAFARVGLRTLVMGRRELTQEEYETWANEYDAARTAVEGRDEKLSACASSIEDDLELIGASAIEDKLQDGVPDAIKQLRASGVSVWVLTGDKAETAKNIGKSCQLLTPSMQIIEVDKDDEQELDTQLTRWLTVLGNIAEKGNLLSRMWTKTKKVGRAMAAVFQGSRRSDLGNVRAESLALVVHGPTALVRILKSRKLTKKLLKLGRCCKSVIACRVSPSQKVCVCVCVCVCVSPFLAARRVADIGFVHSEEALTRLLFPVCVCLPYRQA